MKTGLIFFLLISTTVYSECGLVQKIYGTAKNKTQDFRQGVTDWFSSGVDLLFSDKPEKIYNQGVSETTNAVNMTMGVVEKNTGFIRSIYNGVKDRVGAFGSKMHTTIFGEDTGVPQKGILRSLYDRVENYTIRIKNKIMGNGKQNSEKIDERTKNVREGLWKFFLKNNNNGMFLTNDTYQVLMDHGFLNNTDNTYFKDLKHAKDELTNKVEEVLQLDKERKNLKNTTQ